MVKAGARELMP